MATKKKAERLLPLQNYFADVLRDILENGPSKPSQVSAATGIPRPYLSEMKAGRRRITPENDLLLSRYFGMTPGYLLKLQLAFELERARREIAAKIESIEPLPVSVGDFPDAAEN